MFDRSVKKRLPSECQKYSTRCDSPPMNRDPKTTAALPSRIGIMSLG